MAAALPANPEGTVLVVDDDAEMRETLVSVLRTGGLDACSAGSCADARAGLSQYQPALAVIDERLPDGSGVALAAELRASDPDLVVVIMTAYASIERAIAAIGVADGYLTKPAAPDKVIATVRDRLERRRLVRENRMLVAHLEEANAALEARVAERTKELFESQARFHAIVEYAPLAMVVVSAEGVIQLVNHQSEVLFGYQRFELEGKAVEILLPGRFHHRHERLRGSYFADPQVRPMGLGMELAGRRRDGSEFPVEVSLSPLDTAEGLVVAAAIADITDRKRAEAALAHAAMHDALTGLPNRALLVDRLSQALARAQRMSTTVAVLFCDVDRFKVINDSRGHSAGDEVLRAAATRLRSATRPDDTVARFGGDEFVIVTEVAGDTETPTKLWRRVASALEQPIDVNGLPVTLTASTGVAIASPGATAESLLRDADAAMYRAKEQGRSRIVTFDSAMRASATRRFETETALRLALARAELSVHYQPVLDLTSGRAVGLEALARWRREGQRLVLPGEFIAVAEETGLIVPLGNAMLTAACGQLARWEREHPDLGKLSVAVNLSARQLLSAQIASDVEHALAASGLTPERLCLEITESVLLGDTDPNIRALHALKSLGVHLGVDDFGTGYSSLTYLKRFPVDTLKIDRSFVDGLGRRGEHRGDRAIVAGVIDLAHAFGLTTVAEGVETGEQLAELQALGCEQAQGYYWSRPVAADDALVWLESRARASIAPPLEIDVVAELVASRAPALALPGTSQAAEIASAPRVLLVEDDRSIRRLLRHLLEDRGEFRIVGEAEDGRAGIALARHHQPDVVVLDLAMPGLGGLEALPLITAVAPAAKVVVLSALDPTRAAQAARDVGAAAYFEKSTDLDHLVDYLEHLAVHVP